MADTGEGTVYRGREGTGLAQVFGQAPDPLGLYFKLEREQQQRDLLAAEQKRQAREKRDKELWELQNVNPDKAWEPFNQEIYTDVRGLRDQTAKMAEMSPDGFSPTQKTVVKNWWDQVNLKAAKSLQYKELRDKAIKDVESNPYTQGRVKDYYMPKINDVFFDEQGRARPMEEIDPEQLNEIVNDGGGYDLDKRAKDIVGNPQETVTSYMKRWRDENGVSYSEDRKITTNHFFIPDENDPSGIKKDANGQPIVQISQDAIDAYVAGDPMVKQGVMLEAEARGIAPVEVIKEKLTKAAKEQNAGGLDITPHERADNKWMDYLLGGKLKPDEEKLAGRAFEQIGHMTNAFVDENGNRTAIASPAARAAAGFYKGKKLFGGIVDDVELVPGNNKPGKMRVMGMQVDNSPNDRLIYKVKKGTGSVATPHETDLADEGAPSELWGGLVDSGYMGKKQIAFDMAADQLGVDPVNLYKERANVGARQLAEKAKVDEWLQGKNFEDIGGRTHKGQPITKVKKNTWFGNFDGYTLTLANGEEVKVEKDDFDTLDDILRSPTVKPPAKAAAKPGVAPKTTGGKKDTGVTWE